jgi:hypothetical protein
MPGWLWWLLIPAGLYGLHRLACWMESRGWLCWTNPSGHSTRAGNAMLELQRRMEPSKRHVVEIRADKKSERDSAGDK